MECFIFNSTLHGLSNCEESRINPEKADGVLSTYLQNMQVVSEFCKEKNIERRMVFQTESYSNRRVPKEADMWFQLNLGMAFGTQEFSYTKA